jgi:hypothetical protein
LDRYEKGGHLSQTRHDLAANRYKTIGQLLCARESPFADQDPEVYPQGSMRLGTTVRPLDGPFDLDFVRQLSLPYFAVDPIALLTQLFTFFKANERYKDMVERKNRCVRLNYADDFYMDILPACRDTAAGLTCIRVPDRAMKGWKGSNPIGYTDWCSRSAIFPGIERKFFMGRSGPKAFNQRQEQKPMTTDKAQELTAQIGASIEQLCKETDAAKQSAMYRAWLSTMSRFYNYSFDNQILIWAQCPTATRVAGFHAWKDLGRSVNKGEKAIRILAPIIRKYEEEKTGKVSKYRAWSHFVALRFSTSHRLKARSFQNLNAMPPKEAKTCCRHSKRPPPH